MKGQCLPVSKISPEPAESRHFAVEQVTKSISPSLLIRATARSLQENQAIG